MAVNLTGRVIVPGQASGRILRLGRALSFWGGICPTTATVIQADHPDFGTCISHSLLVLPGLIGSSSSSAVLLELLYKDIAPAAIVMAKCDAILVLGDLVAREMGYATIPMLEMDIAPFENGQRGQLERDGRLRLEPARPA